MFATSQNGYSQPDSIALWNGDVLIGFGNGVAPDGSDGKSSTIVEYKMDGTVVRTYSVLGHNDGLRLNPYTNKIWAIQNEDANPRLTIIDPAKGTQKDYLFSPTLHGGGYDDVAFLNQTAYISASNPTLNSSGVNTAPAIVTAKFMGDTVVTSPFLAGDAQATMIPTKTPVTLNLTDPDSLIVGNQGPLILNDQQDSQLILVFGAGGTSQSIFQLPITSGGVATQIDDTIFAKSQVGVILVSDRDGETVYAISSSAFVTDTYYSAATSGFVGQLDLYTGVLTPLVTGLVSPHGMAFVKVTGSDR